MLLDVYSASVDDLGTAGTESQEIAEAALPTLMRRVLQVAGDLARLETF